MDICKQEVLRYLGYKNQIIDIELGNLIDETINEVKIISKELYTYKIFDLEVLEDFILVKNLGIKLKGKDIYKHLSTSKKCAIMATSLGSFIDNKIRILSKTNLTKAIILDACATEAIEVISNKVEKEIIKIANSEGFSINYRYSPGYGDLPLYTQSEIIKFLETDKKIGLTCTEDNILIPRKSVTAIIGFVDIESSYKKGCDSCNLNKTCIYRRSGNSCRK